MDSKISIVTSFYNNKRFIKRFLDSLENQTNNNFELIIIDDFSKDNEFDFLNEIIKNYSFEYQIFRNKKNMGPGYTRNVGVDKSSYEYITFIDSDDYVTNNFVQELLKIIANQKYDAVIFDYNIETKRYGYQKNSLNTNTTCPDCKFVLANAKGTCWGKLYKKSIIKKYNVKFPDIMRSEDLAFVKVYLSKCQNIYYLKDSLYYYVINTDSIMHKKSTIDIKNNIDAINYILNNIEKGEERDIIYLQDYIYVVVQNMFLSNCSETEIKKFIDKELNSQEKAYENKYFKYLPFHIKICLYCINKKYLKILKFIFSMKK